MSGDIAALRRRLDEIDQEIVDLFEQRMEVSRQIAAYKRKNDLPVLDAGREEQVLVSRTQMLKDMAHSQAIRDLFIEIMRLSRLEQQKLLERGDGL